VTAKSAELKSIAWVAFTFGPNAEGGGKRSVVLVMRDGTYYVFHSRLRIPNHRMAPIDLNFLTWTGLQAGCESDSPWVSAAEIPGTSGSKPGIGLGHHQNWCLNCRLCMLGLR
jgi:hypothetical protein